MNSEKKRGSMGDMGSDRRWWRRHLSHAIGWWLDSLTGWSPVSCDLLPAGSAAGFVAFTVPFVMAKTNRNEP